MKKVQVVWRFCSLAIAILSAPIISKGQSVATEIPAEPSIIVEPAKPVKREKYSVLFVLPFTSSPSEKFMRVYFNDWSPRVDWQKGYEVFLDSLGIKKPLLLVMVSGSSSPRDHDAQGFAAAIIRFESQVKKDLTLLEKKYSIDKASLFLTGFSLGGDLSWAISQRDPGMFKGAVVAGTRCGYRMANSFSNLNQNNFRVYIGQGRNESSVIRLGIDQAKAELASAGIENAYFEIPNVGHNMLPLNKFVEALRFVMQP